MPEVCHLIHLLNYVFVKILAVKPTLLELRAYPRYRSNTVPAAFSILVISKMIQLTDVICVLLSYNRKQAADSIIRDPIKRRALHDLFFTIVLTLE